MSFGMFEANVTSENEERRQVREAANKLAAATYDVRERFGHFLFAARDLAEYQDRLALSKNDILKTIEPHVFPRTGTVRRVLKPLEREFKGLRRLADGASGTYDVNAVNGKDEDWATFSGNFGTPTSGVDMFGTGADGSAKGGAPATPAGSSGTPATPAAPAGGGTGGGGTGGGTGTGGTGGGTGGGGGGSDWSPNGNTDAIGAGDYQIQSGDTLTSISDRSGVSVDDLASGNNIADPDMIYAGDSLSIPGDAADTSATTDTATDPSTPLAAEAGGSADPSGGVAGTGLPAVAPAPTGDALTNPGLTPPSSSREGQLRAARRRRADFERNLDTDVTYHPSGKELKPEGDFKGWLDSVDQDAEGKVDRNFGGTFPGGTEHDGDPAKTDFVKGATLRFARWCQANRVRPTLAALDHYQPSDREYITIAADLQRQADQMMNPYSADGNVNQAPSWAGTGINGTDIGNEASANANTTDYSIGTGGDGTGTSMMSPYVARRRSAAPGVPGSKPKGPEWNAKGKPKSPNAKPDLGTYDDPPTGTQPGGTPKSTLPGTSSTMYARRRRTAAPDYLQKADEALTNLLNQKAEEFQQTIAPLQQALQTVQQAEAEAQAANPLNVMPPAGTVNVLPQPPQGGGDPSGGGGMDPSALAAMMGGGDPSMGGAPPGMDPSAMGGAPPGAAGQGALPPELMGGQQMQARRRRSAAITDGVNEYPRELDDDEWYDEDFYDDNETYQKEKGKSKDKEAKIRSQMQMQARRGKGRGAASPRQAKNVDQLWDEYSQQTTLRGGEPDVETFAQKYRVGPRAMQRIRQKAMGR